MKYDKKYIFVFLMCLALLDPVLALTIQPSVVELSLAAGQGTNGAYLLLNNLGQRVAVRVEPESYMGPAITNWFKTRVTGFTLNPGATRAVEYSVAAPKDFKDELIGKIYFSAVPLGENEAGGASIITRMGSSFYVSAKGQEILSAQADQFQIMDKKLLVQMKNNGNVHLRLYYDLNIFNDKGKELLTTERVPLAVLLAGENKNIAVPFKSSVPLLSGKYYGILNLYFGNIMPLTNKVSSLTVFEVK